MTKLEEILKQAKGLSPIEIENLLRELSEYALVQRGENDTSIGKRGLAAWTESTKKEDWSAFYPDSLCNGKDSHS